MVQAKIMKFKMQVQELLDTHSIFMKGNTMLRLFKMCIVRGFDQ